MLVPEVAPLDALTAAPTSVWRELAAALRAHRYDEGILERAEAVAPGQVDHLRLPVVRLWLERQTDEAAALARLFSYHDALSPERVQTLLGAGLSRALHAAGVLVEVDGGVRSAMRLLPMEGIWVLSDHLAQRGDPAMGPGQTTLRLARWLGDVTSRRVLDVGCGAGTLALLAARRGAHAVAIDISERAIALTKINAALNELEVDARCGDLFAPVVGETFDLVIAQPPFVIRTGDVEALTFLHGGDDGDELTMRLFEELAPSLGPTGRALVFFQAPVRPDRPLLERVSGTTASHGLSLVLSILGYHEPDAVAVVTAAETHLDFGADYERAVRGYRTALADRGVGRVVEAVADLRVGQPRPFSVAVHWTRSPGLSAAHLEEAWATSGALARCGEDLADLPLRLRPGARVESSQALTGEGPSTIHIRVPTAPVREQVVSPDVVSLLAAIDERGTLRAALADLTAPEDVEGLLPRVTGTVRELLLAGVLVVRETG